MISESIILKIILRGKSGAVFLGSSLLPPTEIDDHEANDEEEVE